MKCNQRSFHVCLISSLLRLALGILLCVTKVHAIELQSRITVALLPFEDQTKDQSAAHWRHTVPRMIAHPLYPINQLRVLPYEATDYGLRRSNLTAGQAITAEQAKTIGELIEARRVVWGHYSRKGKTWSATAQVLVVATGQISPPLTASSDDWLTLTQEMADKILAALEITPHEEQKQKMKQRITLSADALESYSLCFSLMRDHRPYQEVEQMVEKAIKFDPQFAEAYVAHGCSLLSQGKMQEGRVQLEKSLTLKPENDSALMSLGVLFGLEGNLEEAAKLYREAIRYGPDEPENYSRLAEYHLMVNEIEMAKKNLEIALQLNMVSANARAQLGLVYAVMGKKDQALRELQEAIMIDPSDSNIYQMTSRAYDRLDMTSLAIEHREKFLSLAKKNGLNPAAIKPYEERLQELRASLKMEYVVAEEPRRYTAEALRKELRDRLTEEEFAQILYPLDSTPAMKKWAQELTKDAKDDEQKARALFDALAARIDPGSGGEFTAEQVFEKWDKPDISFRCQEYARLYVALARDVGLKAYFTRVDRDHKNEVVLHACAAVFIGGKVLLVDPTFRWYGVPHQSFAVSDDFEAVVMQMNQSPGLGNKRIAVKLRPDDLSLFNLAGSLINAKQYDEAKTTIAKFLMTKPEAYMAHYARGAVAWMDKDLDLAEKELKNSLEIFSGESSVHRHLGLVFLEKGLLKEAMESFRNCLRANPKVDIEKDCRGRIAAINEVLSNPTAQKSLTKMDKWREALQMETRTVFAFFEWVPMIYPNVGLIYDNRPEPRTLEIEALRRQAQNEPDNAACRFRRYFMLPLDLQSKEAEAARADAERVARANLLKKPGDLENSYVLLCCLHGNEEAGKIAQQIVAQYPKEWQAWMGLAQYQNEAFLRQLCAGLENLPAQGYDVLRREEAIALRSNSLTECRKLLQMVNESLASAEKAVEISPNSSQALIKFLSFRAHLGGYQATLQKLCSTPVIDLATVLKSNMDFLEKAIKQSHDNPELLSSLTLIQIQAISLQAQAEKGVPYDASAVEKKVQSVIAPTMDRLLQLSRHKVTAIAVAAYEGYSAILMAQKGAGVDVDFPDDFSERLKQSRALAPQRMLLWDIHIIHEALNGGQMNQEQIMKGHALAKDRSKLFPTARGYAILASSAPTYNEEMIYWEKAVTMEPQNLYYSLNLVAAKIRADLTDQNMAEALTRLQETGDKGYENGYWQSFPQHNQYRMKLFVIHQALAGKTDLARRAVDKLLQVNPDDATFLKLGELLDNKPE